MKNLAKKLVDVMKDCGHVSKNGSNDFYKYKYATAADVLSLVNDSLTKHGIVSAVDSNLLNLFLVAEKVLGVYNVLAEN